MLRLFWVRKRRGKKDEWSDALREGRKWEKKRERGGGMGERLKHREGNGFSLEEWKSIEERENK